MLSLLPLLVALASQPSPASSEAPRPTPLTEIGRVRTSVCTTIVVHANGAITNALDNDRLLGIITTNLRNVDFDRLNDLQRRNAINDLMNQASTIRVGGKAADGEIKKLREMAETSTDPQRKAELKAFTDALGGAIYRQTKAAAEFMRDVTVMQGREESTEAHDLMTRANPTPAWINEAAVNQQRQVMNTSPKSYNKIMRTIAEDLGDRNGAILSDEGVAADHSVAAASGC